MAKFEMVDILKENGFTEQPIDAEVLRHCNGIILQRTWAREVEVAWHGKYQETYTARVFINRNSGICEVSYMKNGRIYKSRWYDTVGKRTYNAIVETARCAGYQF